MRENSRLLYLLEVNAKVLALGIAKKAEEIAAENFKRMK